MPEFLRLVSPAEALARWLKEIRLSPGPRVEETATAEALDRILAEDIAAPHSLPAFARSTVDGYAVRAEDTFGASPSAPSYLRLVGEAALGSPSTVEVGGGQAAAGHTG